MKEDNIQNNISCTYLSDKFLKIFDDYSNRLKNSRTKREYQYVIYALCNFAKRDFLKLDKSHIENYLKEINKNKELLTTSFEIKVIRALAHFLDENYTHYEISPGYLELCTFSEAITPDPHYKLENLPSIHDIDLVLQYFKKKSDMVSFLACSLAFRIGLTTKELIKLEKKMFIQDINGNFGIVFQLTNYAKRYIKLPNDLATIISNYTSTRIDEEPALLINRKGKRITERSLQIHLKKACDIQNISNFTYNDLRIVSQTLMFQSGASEEEVAKYVNIKGMDWFFKYKNVIKEFDHSPIDGVHISITWN